MPAFCHSVPLATKKSSTRSGTVRSAAAVSDLRPRLCVFPSPRLQSRARLAGLPAAHPTGRLASAHGRRERRGDARDLLFGFHYATSHTLQPLTRHRVASMARPIHLALPSAAPSFGPLPLLRPGGLAPPLLSDSERLGVCLFPGTHLGRFLGREEWCPSMGTLENDGFRLETPFRSVGYDDSRATFQGAHPCALGCPSMGTLDDH
jgi:hypothetical protein